MHYFYRIFMRLMKDSENNCKYGLDELCPFLGFLYSIEFQEITVLIYTVEKAWNHAWMWFQTGLFSLVGFTKNLCLFLVEGWIPVSWSLQAHNCWGTKDIPLSICSLWSVTALKYVVYRLYVQEPTANILLQNLPSTVGQQQHTVATAQNQLSALLASGSCGGAPTAIGGASNHVVLSQLLQV